MNGYFQVISNNGKCAVKMFPPTDGGEPIRREEILEYLSLKNLTYDVKQLGVCLLDTTQIQILPTMTDFRFPEGEFVKVICAPDNMSVSVRMIPAYQGGTQMSKQEFMREFSSRGICYGFDDAAIDKFLEERHYCTDVVLAKGTPPVQGHDAVIEYFFNTDPRVRPTLNEDGTVDFFNLNTISHVQKGDVLARLHPAEFGTPGINVKGEKIRPRDVKILNLKYGHNISVNEDKTVIVSDVSGHVSLTEGKVFVSDVFQVENVDNGVGNIEYDGNVQINGNVKENFSVKAKGNIEVKGVVEGAYLEAGGDVIIAQGIHGMHKAVIKAGGNVISKFIENCKVQAAGYVECESIMHSEVISGYDIKVTGRHGFIAGGRCSASVSIEVKNLGSNMGADTVVEVGMDTAVKQKILSLQKEIETINKQLANVKPVLESATLKIKSGVKMSTDQLLQIQKLALLNKEQSARLQEAMEELNGYQGAADSTTQGQVVVTGEVYPGTKICIGDVSMVVKNSMKYCRFIKEAGDVKMVAIY